MAHTEQYNQRVETIKSEGVHEQMKHGLKVMEQYLKENYPHDSDDKNAQDALTRVLILMGSCNLQITNEEGKVVNASDNQLAAASYLLSGSRTMIQVENPQNAEVIINWLSSGDATRNGFGNTIPSRSTSTHNIKKRKEDSTLIEDKNLSIGVWSFITYYGKLLWRSISKTGNYGINLRLNTTLDTNKPPEGTKDHGHLFFYYDEELKAILVGVEGAAPDSPNHSKLGLSDPMSPFGVEKLDDLAKKANATELNIVVARKYNGMSLIIDPQNVKALCALNAETVDQMKSQLTYKMPQASYQAFTDHNNKSSDFHNTITTTEHKELFNKEAQKEAQKTQEEVAAKAERLAIKGSIAAIANIGVVVAGALGAISLGPVILGAAGIVGLTGIIITTVGSNNAKKAKKKLQSIRDQIKKQSPSMEQSTEQSRSQSMEQSPETKIEEVGEKAKAALLSLSLSNASSSVQPLSNLPNTSQRTSQSQNI